MRSVFFQLFYIGSKHFARCLYALGASHFRHPYRLELKKLQLRAEKRPTSFAIFLHCPIGWIERRAFRGGDDKVYSCFETTVMEDKLVVAVAGYPDQYDFTHRSYHDLNRKQQTWRQISAVLDISGKLLSLI